MEQDTYEVNDQGKRSAPSTADDPRPAKKIYSNLDGGVIQAEHDNNVRSSLDSEPLGGPATETFDAEVIRQMQLKSLENVRFDTGVAGALASLEQIDELDLLLKSNSDQSPFRFEAKQKREIQRLESLKRELNRWSDTTERALRGVQGSDSEVGLGYDRIVADELRSVSRELECKIEKDAGRLASGNKWMDFKT
ncbi:hypothetical protein H2200_007877 [Cladophialophora chaetospira]|uniref:Uncharacterized protein n=1 Tax=Cladophialophora chaetospira TaxID=386627 RepID=A0AA39CH05_9EURO|nr:hypothetical protein H2200_007877 [Cladophialophora chaetospira]